jgi:adenine phosphoribosyltransferase
MSSKFFQDLKAAIRTVPDFPLEGIMFRDITPVLSDPGLMSGIIDMFARDMGGLGWRPEAVVGPEARGFIFGPLLANHLGIAFIPVRKPGKLPADTIHAEYSLEYGSNSLEMHTDALHPGQKVVIVDDLVATGGTVGACIELCAAQGAEVLGSLFVIELSGLGARKSLSPVPIHALIEFPV